MLSESLSKQVENYPNSGLPLINCQHFTLNSVRHRVLYNLAYLMVGRANYLESEGRRKGTHGELNFREESRLRTEAKLLITLLQVEAGVDLTNEVLLTDIEIHTGTYGFPSEGFEHF